MKRLLFCLAIGALSLQSAFTQKPFIAHPSNAGLEKSHRLGSDWGNQFDDLPADGSALTGFVAHFGFHDHSRVIGGVEPIYLGPKGRVLGRLRGTSSPDPITVEARPGYAVSGIGVKAGTIIDGFQVFFMRILPGAEALDPGDLYVSDWLGGMGGDDLKYLGNNGRLVVGFYGGAGKEMNGFGLIQAAPASLDPPPVQIIAEDDASNYETLWEGAPVKGTGFGPWVFASSDKSRESAGFGIGSSTCNGRNPPSGGIDREGKSWGMRTASDQAATAVRTFAAGPLRPGQQFCLQMDNGEVEGGGSVGFALQNAAAADLLECCLRGGTGRYLLRCNNSELDTGVPFSPDGVQVVVTLLPGDHALFDIRTGSGRFATIPCVLVSSDISQVKLYCRKAGTNLANAVFWNGLRIRQPLLSRRTASLIPAR